MGELRKHNGQLARHVAEVGGDTEALGEQLESLHRRWMASLSDNSRLKGELASLRRALQVD